MQNAVGFLKSVGERRKRLAQLVVAEAESKVLQHRAEGVYHLLQRHLRECALQRINGRGNGGDFHIRRSGAEVGRCGGIKIKLHAVLPGDEALQLQPPPQAALHHAAYDFLLKRLGGRGSAAGAHKTAFVNAAIDGDGHVGIARVGNQIDARDAAHGHAPEHNRSARGKTADRAIKVHHVFKIIAEKAATAEQHDAQHQQGQAPQHKSADSCFV